MAELRTNIDNHGKVLIPSKLRKELGLKQGDTLVIRKINDELRMISLKLAISRIQEEFRKRVGNNKSMVDEFIAERRKEAELEEIQMSKFRGNNA